jgi:hypothetical protein
MKKGYWYVDCSNCREAIICAASRCGRAPGELSFVRKGGHVFRHRSASRGGGGMIAI